MLISVLPCKINLGPYTTLSLIPLYTLYLIVVVSSYLGILFLGVG